MEQITLEHYHHHVKYIACLHDDLRGVWLGSIEDYLTLLDERSYFFMERPNDCPADLASCGVLFRYQPEPDTDPNLYDALRVLPASPEKWARLCAAVALGEAEMREFPVICSYGHC